MRRAVRLSLLAAAALAGVCLAGSAGAQSYGYSQGYIPPPPPPPAPGQVPERDDRYVGAAGTQNTDGSYGYRNYASPPDTTPDDPQGYGYQARKDERFGG